MGEGDGGEVCEGFRGARGAGKGHQCGQGEGAEGVGEALWHCRVSAAVRSGCVNRSWDQERIEGTELSWGGGGYHTVRRPSEMDPTNFNVETVLEAMAGGLIRLSWRCRYKQKKSSGGTHQVAVAVNWISISISMSSLACLRVQPAQQGRGSRAEQLIPVAFIRFGACRRETPRPRSVTFTSYHTL